MSHIYKASEWESPTGQWYCNDIEDLSNGSGYWWIPARILNISLDEYVKLLINTFQVSKISYSIESNVFIFSWSNQTFMRKYKNYINKIAKNKKAYIC